MQPIFVIMSSVPGLLYIGGKWVGEVTEDAPRALPVSPQGPVYIEYHPLIPGYLPMARRITMSGGRIIKESIEDKGGIAGVMWPGGAVELELSPEGISATESVSRFMAAEDIGFEFSKGGDCYLTLSRGGAMRKHALPVNAEPPEIAFFEGRIHMTGGAGEAGRYFLCVSAEDFSPLLSVSGDDVQILENGGVRVKRDLRDTAGHVRIDAYSKTPGGYSEPVYEMHLADPARRLTMTPEETALAAAEAYRLGLTEEAEQYFSKAAERGGMDQVLLGSGVTGMKYFIPGGKNAIGLLKMEAQNLLSVSPLYYETMAAPGGGYQIVKFVQ